MSTMFEKLSAKAKSRASLPQLREGRMRTAARLQLCKEAGVMPEQFIAHLETSLADYDQRIARAERAQIAKMASTMRMALV